MSFEAGFRELMPHSIIVRRFSKASTIGSSQGSYGGPTYVATAATTFQGRLVLRHTKVAKPDGIEFIGDHVAWLATTQVINQRDKVTFEGTTYEILGVGRYPDQDGLHHTKLILRRSTG